MKPRFVPVVDAEGYVRDMHSNGIVQTDDVEYDEYQRKKRQQKERLALIKTDKERINKLETEITEIKQLLHKVLEKITC